MLATGANAPAALDPSRPYGSAAVPNGALRHTADGGVATIHTGRPTKAARRPQALTPEKILQTFNTWAFKREQPDNIPAMLAAISGAAQLSGPVPFVLYWGKGPRHGLDEPDTACL